MQKYFAALSIVLMLGMVMVRVGMLKKRGVRALQFGKLDKSDFLLPPFPLFYFYLIFANTFNLPSVSRQVFFRSEAVAWAGATFCLAGLGLLLWSLASFGRSFRIGIDVETPDRLVTSGAFAVSRNPIYVAFGIILIGQFLIFPNWILLVFCMAAGWLFHRQVRREESALIEHYGKEYVDYCKKVRRYI